MQYLVIYPNGSSQAFYNESVAAMYRTINGGFVVNLMDEVEIQENAIECEFN